MTPLPKRKLSTRRQGDRRSHHVQALSTLVSCSNCHQPTISHRVCPHCGFYKGKLIQKPKEKKEKKPS